jgi:hypothetical protein
MKPRWLIAMTALALALVACGPGGTPTAEESETPEASPSAEASSPAEATPSAEASPSTAAGETTSVFDLAPGDCFNVGDEGTVEQVEKVPCAQLHDNELYAALDHPAGTQEPFPGDAGMKTYADTECGDRFEQFVGRSYAESELYIFYLVPSENTWGAGDREVLCTVYLQDGQLEGSMEGSGR